MARRTPTTRSTIATIALVVACPAWAQNAFQDSMARATNRLVTQLLDAGRSRVAVTDISEPAGTLPASTITYVEEVLIMRLSEARGVTVVERRHLERVLEEQRRTASGPFDERKAIELGKLVAADAIITGRLFTVDKRMHVMLRALDTGTGSLVGTAETFTTFPRGKEPGRAVAEKPAPSNGSVRMRREEPGERNSIVELRAMALGARQWDRMLPGAAIEIGVRSREMSGDRVVPGRAGIGLQLTAFPRIGYWNRSPFDVGHLTDLRATNGYIGTPAVGIGSVYMPQGRLFLMPTSDESVAFEAVTGPNAQGMERIVYDRYRMHEVRMDAIGFYIPIRWYMGENHIYDNVPKLYMEFGFGMDLTLVRARYEVTTTRIELDRSDHSYSLEQQHFTLSGPDLPKSGADIWTTLFTFGGGLEVGRLNFFGQGRFLLASKFTEAGRSYDRVRGNILAYPLLAGADQQDRVLADLAHDGAIPYGATGLERIRSSNEGGAGSTITGNGADRFWRSGQVLVGVSFRFL